MQIKYTYQFKLKLTNPQIERVNNWIDTCRFVYNLALETKIEAWRKGVSLSRFDIIKQLPELKKEEDWIKDVNAQTLQDVIKRLDTAYKKFFKGGGFPRWAKKGRYNSITFNQMNSGTSIRALNHNRIKLPKLGSVKYFRNQPIEGRIKVAIISKKVDGYYISIVTEKDLPQIIDTREKQAGMDLGTKYLCVTSDGKYFPGIKAPQQLYRKLRIAQRSLSRKKKFSNNWYKQKKQVAKIHLKISRIRNDYLNKVSTQLARDYDVIYCEDLRIKNMSKSAKGTIMNPGKNVKAKSGLNRSILNQGWGIFLTKLDYKLKWKGGELIRVNPAYTSQTCNHCGYVSKENRQSQSEFLCLECGHKDNADENAAKNIMGRGTSFIRQREALVCA